MWFLWAKTLAVAGGQRDRSPFLASNLWRPSGSACGLLLLLSSCTGLQQFPDQPGKNCSLGGLNCVNQSDVAALPELDPDYDTALAEIYKIDNEIYNITGPDNGISIDEQKKTKREQQKQKRNEYIERRMAVIDTRFRDFEAALAKENVAADFGVSLLGVAVGSAGSLVAQTASQILSAVSGGLSAAQTAYSKAALYEQVLSALLAQMQAARKSVAAIILEKWNEGLDVYPMWLAKRDVEAYYFAGSIPGAIVATSADAAKKTKEADAILLGEITKESVSPQMFAGREALIKEINGLPGPAAIVLVESARKEFPSIEPFVAGQYPPSIRNGDVTGSLAKQLLSRMVPLTARNTRDLEAWGKLIRDAKGA